MKVNIMDTSKPYEIQPASNGGFVVLNEHYVVPGKMPTTVAACSNAADLLVWLAQQYGLRIEMLYQEDIVTSVADTPEERQDLPWDGKFFPDKGKGLPCVARLRNGDAITIHTGEDDGCQWTWQHRGRQPHDVVAYWLV